MVVAAWYAIRARRDGSGYSMFQLETRSRTTQRTCITHYHGQTASGSCRIAHTVWQDERDEDVIEIDNEICKYASAYVVVV